MGPLSLPSLSTRTTDRMSFSDPKAVIDSSTARHSGVGASGAIDRGSAARSSRTS